jgi:hypothetical protein
MMRAGVSSWGAPVLDLGGEEMTDREKSLGDKVSELVRDVGANRTEARAALDDSDHDVDRARRLLIKRGQSGRDTPGYSPKPGEE